MTEPSWKSSKAAVETVLARQVGGPMAHYPIRHGSMRVGLYSPQGSDDQTPHKQDELYIIASGNGVFIKGDERTPFAPQDLLFVEAGVEHRFEDFTIDFAAWVVFWGPEGGEK